MRIQKRASARASKCVIRVDTCPPGLKPSGQAAHAATHRSSLHRLRSVSPTRISREEAAGALSLSFLLLISLSALCSFLPSPPPSPSVRRCSFSHLVARSLAWELSLSECKWMVYNCMIVHFCVLFRASVDAFVGGGICVHVCVHAYVHVRVQVHVNDTCLHIIPCPCGGEQMCTCLGLSCSHVDCDVCMYDKHSGKSIFKSGRVIELVIVS
jgi:hypothetical protein